VVAALLDPILGALANAPNLISGVRSDPRWDTPRRRERGLIIVLGGIEGPSAYQRYLASGLVLGRWRGAVQVHPWGGGIYPIRYFRNLMSPAHHERSADAVAAMIRAYRRDYPDAPVGLLALSGGCWVAVRTLERLGAEEPLQTTVLLAAAISPGYDLSAAASRCRRGLYTVRGPGDAVLLGLGTSLLGTSDRRWGPAGGWVGWRPARPGVIDRCWHPQFIRKGYLGNHTSVASRRFIAAEVARWYS